MSDKLRAKLNALSLVVTMALGLAAIGAPADASILRYHRSNRAMEGSHWAGVIGYGLVATGGVVALGGLIGVLFVPAATFPTVDAELTAFFGVVLLISGIIVRAFGYD